MFYTRLLQLKVTITELISSKVVKTDDVWAKVAKLPWGPPKGPMAGGECFAPLKRTGKVAPLSGIARQRRPLGPGGPFGGVPRSQMMKFGNFINIENINRSASGITPEHPW